MNRRILFATPLICIMIYFIIGYIFGEAGWAIGSVVFLAIPLMPYILKMRKFKITFPLCVTISFYLICIIGEICGKHLWNIAWIIYFLIPIYAIFKFPTTEQIKEKIEKRIQREVGYEEVKSTSKTSDDDDDTVYEAK